MPRPNLSSLSLPLAHLLVLSAFAVVHALASPFPISSSSALPQRRADPDPQPCGFDGDDNTYGLGIRLGLYIQGLGTILSDFLEPGEAKKMKDVNLSFQLSVFGGLIYITITRGSTQAAGQLYAAEVLMMLHLCTKAVFDPNPDPSQALVAIHLVQFAFSLTMLSYTLWFLFIGMDQMAHPPCSRYAFVLAKVDMYHWYRLARKILAIIYTVLDTCGLVWTLRQLYTGAAKGNASLFPSSAPPPRRSLLGQFIVLAFIVTSTELLIRWNHIHNVYSVGGTGQLIPLIVSSMGFIPVVYKLFIKYVVTP
ncbi:hypothetical protein M407DRAFT_22954 [Tulasnella calospora MUT 4182]|uniref:TLC domain-containing protein n=1 Tax=Tulasnella calospora MUT 4182 TaxID=1051891 RepID=A0A0C3L208_9AGAM|nr:hypothetical protein M407DRAFT_22954 [Tulasnella calospora MUT 4182]